MLEREEWLAWYAERGLTPIPLRPRQKRPLRPGWQKPSDDAWRDAPADANVGVLCGGASGGLVVLDFDTPDGLREASGMRPEELGLRTLVVKTARGWHVYARDPAARTSSPWKGLDVRAEGAMVVAPPSVHPSGIRYQFLLKESSIAPLASLPFALEPEPPVDKRPLDLDWEALDAVVAAQSPKLRAHWALLKEPVGQFDRSRADFAIARCLWEAGRSAQEVAAVLRALPGSKAVERGEAYAVRTATRAASARR